MSNPVASPISEQILEEMVETLSGVSTAANYMTDLAVEREEQGGNGASFDGQCIVGSVQPIAEFDKAPLGWDQYVLRVGVLVYAIESETDGANMTGRLSAYASDVRRALLQDLHRGGLANNTEFDQPDELHVEDGYVIVPVKVTFRTLFGDPYRRE